MTCTDPLSAQPTPAPQSRAQHRLHSTYPPSTDKRTRHNGCQSPSRATLDPKFVRGEQCAEAPLGRWRSDRAACLVVRLAVSRAGRSPHRRAVMVAERRMRCPHRNTARRPAGHRLVVGPSCPDACRALVTCPRPRSASTCPVSGVRCPVSGVSVQCPRVRCPRVRCPMSGCPASVSARPASASAVSAPGDFVERAATRPGRPGSNRPAVPANGSITCLTRNLALGAGRLYWASGDVGLDLAVVAGDARAAGQVRPPGRPKISRLSARIARQKGSGVVRDELHPPAAWLRRSSGQECRAWGRL